MKSTIEDLLAARKAYAAAKRSILKDADKLDGGAISVSPNGVVRIGEPRPRSDDPANLMRELKMLEVRRLKNEIEILKIRFKAAEASLKQQLTDEENRSIPYKRDTRKMVKIDPHTLPPSVMKDVALLAVKNCKAINSKKNR